MDRQLFEETRLRNLRSRQSELTAPLADCSRLVIDEASAGDAEATARRLVTLNGISRLELTESASTLAARLVMEGAIPLEATEDALHVAVAAAHGMDYLLTP